MYIRGHDHAIAMRRADVYGKSVVADKLGYVYFIASIDGSLVGYNYSYGQPVTNRGIVLFGSESHFSSRRVQL